MPENMSQERIKLMRHFGAEVILTPAEDGMKGSIAKADILTAKNPNVILLRQFENEANGCPPFWNQHGNYGGYRRRS